MHSDEILDYPDSFQYVLRKCVEVEINYTDEIENWCKENSIDAFYAGTNYGKDIWFVKNYDERVMFALRWA